MFLCTHKNCNLIIFPTLVQTQALLFHDPLPVGWGGVGWDNKVHVSVHTQAPQPHQLSYSGADRGTDGGAVDEIMMMMMMTMMLIVMLVL